MDRSLCHHIFSASMQSIIRKKIAVDRLGQEKLHFIQKKKELTSIIAITNKAQLN
jgi:hypothetical protein